MGIWRMALRGVAAGVVATAAMDLLWYRRYRADGGDQSFGEWEFSTSTAGYADAPAPAQVGKRIADAVGIDLPDSSAGTVNNAVHWATGAGWGKVAGLASAVLPVSPVAAGVLTGVSAWSTSYVVLGAVGIYRPIAEYDGQELWKDLSAHLVFGGVLGLALATTRVIRRRPIG